MKNEYSERLQALIDAKKITQAALAEAIGVSPARVSVWLSGKVERPRRPTSSKLAEFFGCRLEWLHNGEGDMFDAPRHEVVQAVELVASYIEPYASEQESEQHDDAWSLEEMLEKTTAVLQSKTIYRSALASNVRAFYQAVGNEGEMRTTRETLTRLETKMARLEQLILAMAGPVGEKREQAGR